MESTNERKRKKGEMREQKVYYHNMPLSARYSCPGITILPVLASLGRKHLIIPTLSHIFSPTKGGFFFRRGEQFVCHFVS